MTHKLDLSTYGALIFTGRPNGERVREKLHVEEYSSSEEDFLVIVPDETKTLNSSFLLGFLGDEIVKCKTKESFLDKFKFKMPPRFYKQLDTAIRRALFKLNHDARLV